MTAKEIRVLHIFSSFTAGGAENMTLQLAAELSRKTALSALGCPKGSYMYEKAKERSITVFDFKSRGTFTPSGVYSLYRLVRDNNINILHVHQGKLFWTAVLIHLFTFCRVKTVFHKRMQTRHKFYARAHYKFADKVIAVSKAVKNSLIKQDNVNPEKIEVIYNGCNFKRFNDKISGLPVRAKYNVSADDIVVGTAGQMNYPKAKGQGYLIEAAVSLAKKYDNLKFIICGEGPMLDDFKEQARLLDVTGNVIFTGFVGDIENYIAAMDIFSLNSWDTEGAPNVVIEAQAMKKAIIATDIGGIAETFLDGVSGLLIEPENVRELAEKIEFFMKDKSKIKMFGAAGQEFVHKTFTVERMVDAVSGLYAGLFK